LSLKKAEAGVAHIAYSAKIKKKNTNHTGDKHRRNRLKVLFMIGILSTNYRPKKTLFMIPSAEEVSTTVSVAPVDIG
jgi:hypothetical protein